PTAVFTAFVQFAGLADVPARRSSRLDGNDALFACPPRRGWLSCAPRSTTIEAMRRKLVAGNWKMHSTRASAGELVDAIVRAGIASADVAVFPPYVYL